MGTCWGDGADSSDVRAELIEDNVGVGAGDNADLNDLNGSRADPTF